MWPPNYVLLVSILNTTQSFEGRQFPDFFLPELSFFNNIDHCDVSNIILDAFEDKFPTEAQWFRDYKSILILPIAHFYLFNLNLQ